MTQARTLTPTGLLIACAATAIAVQLMLWYAEGRGGWSPIFWYLLKTYDTHGNVLVALIVVAAFALRRRQGALPLVSLAAERPWAAAALAFPLLCIGAVQVYRGHPVSMDEYSTLFQAKVFAEGRLDGRLPPELLDLLVPRHFQGMFFSVSRATGDISTIYWPSFPLILVPFVLLGVPWMANPLLGALALPGVHGITRAVTGSKEAAGWALLLTAASPVFVVTSLSLYSMPAHLLFNLWYAWLLLRPTPRRAFLAGFCGAIALTLHYPLRHVLFAAPFFVWVALQPGRVRNLAALVAGYLPLGLLLGFGWHQHITDPARLALPASGAAAGLAETARESALVQTSPILGPLERVRLPGLTVLENRVTTLTKDWTWSAAGLIVLAAFGAVRGWSSGQVRVLTAAVATTFLGYFASAGDQGHGWGDRTLYQAWFVFPLLAASAVLQAPGLRAMVAWCAALSLVLANGLRLVQVQGFVGQFLGQVPPLLRKADPARPEALFIDIAHGFYTRDLVQNDPFMRGPRIVMRMGPPAAVEAFMARRFPDYRKVREGPWGQLWERGAPK